MFSYLTTTSGLASRGRFPRSNCMEFPPIASTPTLVISKIHLVVYFILFKKLYNYGYLLSEGIGLVLPVYYLCQSATSTEILTFKIILIFVLALLLSLYIHKKFIIMNVEDQLTCSNIEFGLEKNESWIISFHRSTPSFTFLKHLSLNRHKLKDSQEETLMHICCMFVVFDVCLLHLCIYDI